MQTKRVKCPKCGVMLEVKNSKNEVQKVIICPKCKTKLKVNFPPQQEPIEAPTVYGTPKPSGDGGATQLGSGLSGATVLSGVPSGSTQYVAPSQNKATGTPYLLYEGKKYSLQEGKNIVGRKAKTSEASVQIETSDRYMSRQHCNITVTTMSDESKKVVFSNYQNKNQTIIDGQEICTGDEIRLTDGDSITMGHTTIIFKLS